AISFASFATPISLGDARNYTLLATGTPWYDGWMGGYLGLGAAAHIYGNVGARGQLNIGSSATVDNDADYGNLLLGSGASVSGSKNQQGTLFWNSIYDDLKSASEAAYNWDGTDKGYVNSTQTFNSQ